MYSHFRKQFGIFLNVKHSVIICDTQCTLVHFYQIIENLFSHKHMHKMLISFMCKSQITSSPHTPQQMSSLTVVQKHKGQHSRVHSATENCVEGKQIMSRFSYTVGLASFKWQNFKNSEHFVVGQVSYFLKYEKL